mmetsp:Transcript_12874/g.24480  ORF Transcript_12874/g.24480 Transcript_12874/m.24480 type:complete len:206 (+) Transcript_12874:163-780(+)
MRTPSTWRRDVAFITPTACTSLPVPVRNASVQIGASRMLGASKRTAIPSSLHAHSTISRTVPASTPPSPSRTDAGAVTIVTPEKFSDACSSCLQPPLPVTTKKLDTRPSASLPLEDRSTSLADGGLACSRGRRSLAQAESFAAAKRRGGPDTKTSTGIIHLGGRNEQTCAVISQQDCGVPSVQAPSLYDCLRCGYKQTVMRSSPV